MPDLADLELERRIAQVRMDVAAVAHALAVLAADIKAAGQR